MEDATHLWLNWTHPTHVLHLQTLEDVAFAEKNKTELEFDRCIGRLATTPFVESRLEHELLAATRALGGSHVTVHVRSLAPELRLTPGCAISRSPLPCALAPV